MTDEAQLEGERLKEQILRLFPVSGRLRRICDCVGRCASEGAALVSREAGAAQR